MKKQLLLLPLLGLLLAGCQTPIEESASVSSMESSCEDTDLSSSERQYVPMKPIIYFYPEEEMDLKVTYVEEERLLTTYPKYDNGWDMHLEEDGNFTIKGSDREYYALYFDEIGNYETDWSEGFYVTKENAITILEEKMDYIGYTNREVDEFIMYWLPVLENNEKSLIYFEQKKGMRNALLSSQLPLLLS